MSVQSTPTEMSTMRAYLAEVFVSLKPAVNDPEGLAIRDGLRTLGYDEVEAVRSGKYLRLTLHAPSEEAARARITEMCDKLLANPVTETFHIDISPLAAH